MTSFGPDRTYAATRDWLSWDGRDDHESEPDAHPYPDAAELEALLDHAEDHRNESRLP